MSFAEEINALDNLSSVLYFELLKYLIAVVGLGSLKLLFLAPVWQERQELLLLPHQ